MQWLTAGAAASRAEHRFASDDLRISWMSNSAVAPVVALAVASCGDAPPEAKSLHAPRTAEEKRAAAVFAAYLAAAQRDDAASACRHLVARAARRHHCAGDRRIPPGIRRALGEVGDVVVRDTEGYDADVHLSAPVRTKVGERTNLVLFFDREADGGYSVTDVIAGSYG